MSPRMSAEERRTCVVAVAMSEFARGGYEGTSTESIAKGVGVSQPYLFRLFPNKRAIFLAAALRCIEMTRDTFVQAADGVPPGEVYEALAVAYMDLIADHELLMMQMQVQVAVFQAKQSGDEEFGKIIRRGWTDLYDTVCLLLGGDHETSTRFMASGMLINTMVALDYAPEDRLWGCMKFLPCGP
ncbi:TetR/AcrR family transcriptional regulator [Actinocorallia sp. B10E7]|uniref:TetR/AcrR family transcriptional regulator n=1 Tax=Actinocorallia sp. B10E7 TaxID=3153558 RepID=UPI00325E5D00